MQILGFTEGTPLGPVTHIDDYYESNINAQLNNIQNVLILASFINGSYYNGQTQNILDTITFQLVDQDYESINMGVLDPVHDVPERWSARIIIVDSDLVK